MINVADLPAVRDRAQSDSVSNSGENGFDSGMKSDGSGDSAEQDAKRAPELALSNGRYYVAKAKK